ncbi:MAG: translocation/assembly module TamB domain-containing protein [Bacteroidales bacterium]|jgi:hypothetical protein
MGKGKSLLRKFLKVIMWVIIVLLLLFILIVGLIQFPAVQTKIIHSATSIVSSKTHTKVEIEKISISFPKSVVIGGLFLEDMNRDTLVYANELKVNISLIDLLSNKLNVGFFGVNDMTLNLYNTESDSLFNYNFLIAAFADTSQPSDQNKSPWAFNLGELQLTNIRLHYHDEYTGMNLNALLGDLKLEMDEIDLNKSIFGIDELRINSLSAELQLKESQHPSVKSADNSATGSLPKIIAGKIQIENSSLKYADDKTKENLFASIHQFELENADLDLENERADLDNISLAKSSIRFTTGNTVQTMDSTQNQPPETNENNWKVGVKSISLEDNFLAYHMGNNDEKTNSFNTDHQEYNHVNLTGSELFYSREKMQFHIKEFSAIDQHQFSIAQFETDFTMDQHSMAVKNLKLKTTHSSVIASIELQYTSLQSLKDSLPFLIANINLNKASISNSDVLYFSPQLAGQPFFENRSNTTTLSGNVTGPVNNLTGKNLVVTTGNITSVTSDFNITGLPDIRTAHFSFPNLSIASGKNDLEMMIGSSLPENLDLPENISLEIDFIGTINDFKSTVSMDGSFGAAHLFASLNRHENFQVRASIDDFDLGKLMMDTTLFGPVSLTVEAIGHGLDPDSIKSSITAEVSAMYFNRYTYQQLEMDGNITGRQFEGSISMNDKNAVFDFNGLVNISPGREQFKFSLNLEGADLKKLHLTEDDIQIGLHATADLTGVSADTINGKAGITDLIVVHNGKKYEFDSVLLATTNENNKSEFTLRSPLADINYLGTIAPTTIPKVLNQFMGHYFQFSDTTHPEYTRKSGSFNFEVQIHSHPLLTEVLLPELNEFEPGAILGSFDGDKMELKLNTTINTIVYGTNRLEDIRLEVNSDSSAINYIISSSSMTSPQLSVNYILVEGKIADNKLETTVSSTDDQQNKKLLIGTSIEKDSSNYKLALNPNDFYLMGDRWTISPDNYVLFGKQGFLVHNLNLSKLESQISITSVNNKFNDDLDISITNFKLNDIFGIIEKDSNLVRGTLTGDVLLKRVNESYGIIANAQIDQLTVTGVPVGNLSIKAENPTADKFDIEVHLKGTDNNLTAKGHYIPNGGNNAIYLDTKIPSLSMKTIEAFSMGQIKEASGSISGNILIKGATDSPEITGELVFNNSFINPVAINNRIELKHETIQLKNDGIYFDDFTLLDINQNTAIIDGSVKMKQMKDFVFALRINTKDFLLINTTSKDNKGFFGKMIVDSKIDIKGPLSLPVINGNIKMKNGSVLTFAVPENKLTTNRGQGVVEFMDRSNNNAILNRNENIQEQKSSITGIDLSSIIEIDKKAKLKLLLDPTSNDSLVVQGEAALSLTMDRSGKLSLTGAYQLTDGSYMVSLESIVKKKFVIEKESTIVWNGDPLDADITINATYQVRTSPINLIGDQMTGINESDKNAYKQRYPFQVQLKLRGELLHPEISFEIKLLPEDKGILGGAVDAKLSLLNENPSELNKQVFALLVLGRFVQENPLQSGTNDEASAVVRATVSKFLSAELNKWSSKMVPGVEINLDVRSYDDYQSEEAVGRTQVDIGLKKQLFDERLSVQVGGVVDVEGAKAKQNSVSDITSDVSVEYKLTKDGRYRLIGFSHNQYEGAIEGQVIETGVGIIYMRDFDQWKEFFKTLTQQK